MNASRRSRLAALVVGVALVASACAGNNDPSTWEEAEAQDGFPVRTNFIDACREANTGSDALDDATATAYCGCAFGKLHDNLSFADFEKLDDDLRANPTEVPDEVRTWFEECLAQATGA
ncbi:MAG: hypothetical protein D6683_07225 [Actinomyces sp.]|nr:MAG: hypothetical protein D6683_07225 [Actinomyces sp.]